MQDGGFRTLPRVQEYLLDIKVFDQLEEVVAKHELPSERLEELLDLSNAVIRGRLKIEQIPELVGKAFGVDPDKARAISADVAGYRLLPLSVFIPEVEDRIKEWGGDVADYPKLRIAKPKAEDKLLEYAREIGLELPENLMKRFVYLSRGYIKKERDRDATVTLMKRPMNIGGLDLKEEQIKQLLSALDERFGKEESGKVVEVVDDQEVENDRITATPSNSPLGSGRTQIEPEKVSPVVEMGNEIRDPIEAPLLAKEGQGEVSDPIEPEKPRVESHPERSVRNRQTLPIKAVPHALTTDVPVISGHLFDHEREEIKQHTIELEKKGLKDNGAYDQKLSKIVADTTQAVTSIFKIAKQSQKSAQTVVEAFVRGRLDEHRTDALLQQKYGMSGDQAHEVLVILKKGYAELHKREAREPIRVKADIVQKERSVLDERHAALTSSVPKKSIEPIMPKARVSASRSKEEELDSQLKKVDQKKVKEAQKKARPEKVKIRLSKQSAPPKKQVEVTRKMADIKKVSRLIGPVEELGTMGIVEFRRLSSDPKEAIEKVLNTLDLLEETDYEDRIRGIQAWRKSPLNNLYISLVQEALSEEITVADAAAQKRNTGDESLSAAEIDAIVSLNKKISF